MRVIGKQKYICCFFGDYKNPKTSKPLKGYWVEVKAFTSQQAIEKVNKTYNTNGKGYQLFNSNVLERTLRAHYPKGCLETINA